MINRNKKAINKSKVTAGHGLKCQDCGKRSSDVKHTTCPFSEEIYGKIVDCVLCPECKHERAMDI